MLVMKKKRTLEDFAVIIRKPKSTNCKCADSDSLKCVEHDVTVDTVANLLLVSPLLDNHYDRVDAICEAVPG